LPTGPVVFAADTLAGCGHANSYSGRGRPRQQLYR